MNLESFYQVKVKVLCQSAWKKFLSFSCQHFGTSYNLGSWDLTSRNFLETLLCAPEGSRYAIFALVDLDPSYFNVGIVSAPPDNTYMSKNGQMCFFSTFWVSGKKIIPKYRSTLKTLTLSSLTNSFMIFYMCWHISFWDITVTITVTFTVTSVLWTFENMLK